jgi:hypothetical protein
MQRLNTIVTGSLNGGVMPKILQAGEHVRHRARAQWGIGQIVSINSCGTIKVVFEGNKLYSIAKGINYLIKVDEQGHKI